MAPASRRVAVVGAGIGSLTAGALLASRGHTVTVCDCALCPRRLRFNVQAARFHL